MESSGETPQRAAVDDYVSWALITNPHKLPQLQIVESIKDA